MPTASLTFWPFPFPKAPFTGKPSLSKINDVIEYKPTDFKCEGSPGYPDGKMEFQIQPQNDTDFRSFEFPKASVIDKDRNCARKQIIKSHMRLQRNGMKPKFVVNTNIPRTLMRLQCLYYHVSVFKFILLWFSTWNDRVHSVCFNNWLDSVLIKISINCGLW